jgi:hypothetical protein
MDRLLASLLFACALLCIVGAGLLLLEGFISYLQTDRWRTISLLQAGYDAHLLRPRWFLLHDWSEPAHRALGAVPLFAALLVIAPMAWWSSNRLDSR